MKSRPITTSHRYQIIAGPDFLICSFCSGAAHKTVRLATGTGRVLLVPPFVSRGRAWLLFARQSPADQKWLPTQRAADVSASFIGVIFAARQLILTIIKLCYMYTTIFRVSLRVSGAFFFFFYDRTLRTDSVVAGSRQQRGLHQLRTTRTLKLHHQQQTAFFVIFSNLFDETTRRGPVRGARRRPECNGVIYNGSIFVLPRRRTPLATPLPLRHKAQLTATMEPVRLQMRRAAVLLTGGIKRIIILSDWLTSSNPARSNPPRQGAGCPLEGSWPGSCGRR